jgi:hypothetical protein
MTKQNPPTVVYFTALVLGTQTATAPARADQAVFVLPVFVAPASWQLGPRRRGLLGRLLSGGRGRLITAIASSTLIGALALHLLIAAS